MRVNLPISDIEFPLPEGEVLVSKTDLKGVITYCNRAFIEVSGYRIEELIGAPHNLVRHPDTPPEIFADCWTSIQSGRPWHGVLKNRRKNGDHYWLEANVSPLIDSGVTVGYVSLRYKPTAEQIAGAEKFYRAKREGRRVPFPKNKPDPQYVSHLQQQLATKIVTLENYYDHIEDELRVGSGIMSRVVNMGGTQDRTFRQKVIPASHYSGDMILLSRTPSDVLHILLADAAGHGLVAALNALPLSQAFYAMSRKGLRISRIAEELNQKIHDFMPTGRFAATTLISIDRRGRLIEAWNGGNPAAILVSRGGKILHKWQSGNPPLGVLGARDFSGATERLRYEEDSQLFLFSDGLPEAQSPRGMPFGSERVEALLQSARPERRFDELVGALEDHLAGRVAHDDVSLAMVSISLLGNQASA